MKHQQVVPDYWVMLKTSFTCLALVASGYVFLKLVQTIFLLPSYLQQNQKNLEKLAEKLNVDIDKINENEHENENLLSNSIAEEMEVEGEEKQKDNNKLNENTVCTEKKKEI